MPSSLVAGPIYKFLRIARSLTILSSGRFVIQPRATRPDNPVAGTFNVTAAGVVEVYTGSAWVVVGSQS